MRRAEEIPLLKQPTDRLWFAQAWEHHGVLLLDHAHCEKKAARSALQLINSYPSNARLVRLMAQLAREELLHLRQVIDLLSLRKLQFTNIKSIGYASALHAEVAKFEPDRCVDLLICGALIEARSCERFTGLAEAFAEQDPQLARYYRFLCKAEARHHRNYLDLAGELMGGDTLAYRVEHLAVIESRLVNQPGQVFRMHSGPVMSVKTTETARTQIKAY